MTSSAVLLATACLMTSASLVAAGCGFPGAPAHSTVTFSTVLLETGTEATYSCERGFELLGPARRQCQSNGTWTPAGIPFCVINVAAGKAPMQSSTHQDGIPQKAVDGSTSGIFSSQTCTLTQPETSPLWYVNLLEPFMIQLVRVDFGQACCERNAPATVVVRVGNNRPDLLTNPICNRYTGLIEEGRPLFLPCNPPMPGAFVSVHLEGPGQKRLSICETFVYTDQALPVERCPQFRGQPLGASATYNGRCYSFYNNQPRSFGRAQEFCAAREGTLISETSPALQGFLSWELWRRHRSEPDGQYWLGAVRDPHRPSIWSWITGQQVAVSFWSVPERVTGGDCARLDATKDWLWTAADCRQRLNFVCQHAPLTCGRPEQPPDSTMSVTELGIGARVEYRCEPGHLLIGPEERECLATGFYSGYPPTCKRLQCGLPADVANGSYRFLNGSRAYLSSVVYSCQPGYTLVGRSELICDVDERWNGPPPRCQEIRCGTPPAILNGGFRLLNNATSVGSLVEYQCLDERFELIGLALLRCGADGVYDSEPPVCRVPEAGDTTANNVTTAAPAAPVDLSFLDEALAASASEVNEEHTIDLGDLIDLLSTGVDLLSKDGHLGQGTENRGAAGDSQGAAGGPTGLDQYLSPGIESRIDDIPLGPRANDTETEDVNSVTDVPEYASETAAAHLTVATDLSFAYQPTEGNAAFDILIQYQPSPEGVSSAAPPATDPHRRGRPLPTRPSLPGSWSDQWDGRGEVTRRPDTTADWSERTPSWSPPPPRLTISLSDFPTGGGPANRLRPRPTPATTVDGFFRVVTPEEYERRENAAAGSPESEPIAHPTHRRRYRPVERVTHLPTPADEGSYGLRRRFRPISLADLAAADFTPSSSAEDELERRKRLRSEELIIPPRTSAESTSSNEEDEWRPRPSIEQASEAPVGRQPEVEFTLMPPSFWPDLHPAQSDASETEGLTPPPFRPARFRPPPTGTSGEVNRNRADLDPADYDAIEASVRAETHPPTIAWEPERTTPSPVPDTPPSPPSSPFVPSQQPPTTPTTPPPPPPPPPPQRVPPSPSSFPPSPSEPPRVTAAEPASTGRPVRPTDERTPVTFDRSEEVQAPDTVNIRQDARPGVRLPDVGEGERDEPSSAVTPRLNLSGFIALGVFGGFVFLTAVLTSIVIIVRRTQRRTRKRPSARRHHYISSSYSTDSESHNLSRHSRRGAWAHGRQPGRRSSSQGYRDSAEVTVADVSHIFRGGGGRGGGEREGDRDKRRHHHHHHHHRHHHGHGHGDERTRRH